MLNSTREVLIDIVGWYDSVSAASSIAVDDIARLKPIADRAKIELESSNDDPQFWLFELESDKDQFDR
jgi:hypothetical protein